jgi:hypothetical protein
MTAGTKEDPWVLTTPPGTSRYTMYGDDRRTTPSAAGTASARATAAGSGCTSRPCWKHSAWPRSPTNPATTACE